jgi:hypothetical protein
MMKCGFCQKTITKLKLSTPEGDAGGVGYRCVAFTCPNCSCVLSAQVNPQILNSDLLTQIKKLFSRA